MKKKVSFVVKDDKVIYRWGHYIVCYRRGATYYLGKPSDSCVLSATTDSEETAHGRCMEIAESHQRWADAWESHSCDG